jgi:hypothetical protein
MNRAGACWRLLFTLSLMPWLDSARFEDCYDVTEYEKAVAAASTKNLNVEEQQQLEQKAASTNSLHMDEQPLEQITEEDIVVDAEIGGDHFDQQISSPSYVEPPIISLAGMQETPQEGSSSLVEIEDEMNEFLYENLVLTDEELYFCRPEDWIQKVQKER